MLTGLNLVATGAAAAYLLGKISLKTALIVGVGALVLAGVTPSPTSTALTTTH